MELRRGEVQRFPSSAESLPPAHYISNNLREDAFNDLLQWIKRPSEAVYPRRPLRVYAFRGSTFSPAKPRSVIGRVFTPRLSVSELRDVRAARFCVGRKERREVLFALKRAGFSGSAPKRHYRRTSKSQWRC